MTRRPPGPTVTDPLLPDTPLFRATQRASPLSVPTHRNAGGDAPSGRPAPPSADNDHHRCRQAEFRAAQCRRKQSSMVKKLTRTVLSAADVGVPVLLLSLLAASVHADRKSTRLNSSH